MLCEILNINEIMRKQAASKWSKRGERFNILNIPCILPPNTEGPILHSILLRSRYEEIQYQLAHLDQETQNIIRFDSSLSNSNAFTYNSDGYRNDNNRNQIRARDQLFIERKNLINSIDSIYPSFRVPGAIRISYVKCKRKFYISNPNLIGFILGPRGVSLKQMENELGVHVSIRGKGSNPNPKAESNQDQDELHALIESDTESKIDECIKRLEQLLIPLPDSENERKKQQLSELARLRGHTLTSTLLEDDDPNSAMAKKQKNPPWINDLLNLDDTDELIKEAADQVIADIDSGVVPEDSPLNAFDKYKINLDRVDLSMLVPEPSVPGLDDVV